MTSVGRKKSLCKAFTCADLLESVCSSAPLLLDLNKVNNVTQEIYDNSLIAPLKSDLEGIKRLNDLTFNLLCTVGELCVCVWG